MSEFAESFGNHIFLTVDVDEKTIFGSISYAMRFHPVAIVQRGVTLPFIKSGDRFGIRFNGLYLMSNITRLQDAKSEALELCFKASRVNNLPCKAFYNSIVTEYSSNRSAAIYDRTIDIKFIPTGRGFPTKPPRTLTCLKIREGPRVDVALNFLLSFLYVWIISLPIFFEQNSERIKCINFISRYVF